LANFMTFVVATLAFFNLNSRAGFCGFWLIDDSRFPSRTSRSSTHKSYCTVAFIPKAAGACSGLNRTC
jgi:hypothetical protein